MNKHEWVLKYMSIYSGSVTISDALAAYDQVAQSEQPPGPGEVVRVMHAGDTIPYSMQGKYIRVCAV